MEEGITSRIQKNKAVRLFIGETGDEPQDLRQFETWYSSDILTYLTHLPTALPDMFNYVCTRDPTDETQSYYKQLVALCYLSSALEKCVCFISTKSPTEQNHFIFGVILNQQMLIIDPVGMDHREKFIECIWKIKMITQLTHVYYSNVAIQKEKDKSGLYACGAICAELMQHVSQLPFKTILKLFEQWQQSNKQEIDITELLPTSLKACLALEDKAYREHIIAICLKHLRYLEQHPNQAKRNLDQQDEILDKCLNCAEQAIMFDLPNIKFTEKDEDIVYSIPSRLQANPKYTALWLKKQFFTAIQQGDFSIVTELLQRQPLLLNTLDCKGNTVLMTAIRFNQESIVSYLLAQGATIDAGTALYENAAQFARSLNNEKLAKQIEASVKKKSSDNNTDMFSEELDIDPVLQETIQQSFSHMTAKPLPSPNLPTQNQAALLKAIYRSYFKEALISLKAKMQSIASKPLIYLLGHEEEPKATKKLFKRLYKDLAQLWGVENIICPSIDLLPGMQKSRRIQQMEQCQFVIVFCAKMLKAAYDDFKSKALSNAELGMVFTLLIKNENKIIPFSSDDKTYIPFSLQDLKEVLITTEEDYQVGIFSLLQVLVNDPLLKDSINEQKQLIKQSYQSSQLLSPKQQQSHLSALQQAYAEKKVKVKQEAAQQVAKLSEKQKEYRNPLILPYMTRNYIDRSKRLELEQKMEKLEEGGKLPTICAIVGLSGVGKTQFALDYLYHPPKSQNATMRAWFRADNDLKLREDYVAFGIALKIISEEMPQQEIITAVKTYLEKYPGWLLVYDNALELDMLLHYLPQAMGRILITSQNPNWQNSVELSSMSEEKEAAIQLLYKSSGREDEEAQGLAATLGYLPLALAQAGAYIKQRKITTKKYLHRLEVNKKAILASEEFPIGETHDPVAMTWNICLNVLKKHPQAIELLHICCYFNSTDIPNQVLCEALLGASDDESINLYEQIRRRLENYSLITVNPNQDTVSIHNLVQTVIGMQIAKEQEQGYVKKIIVSLNKLFNYKKYSLNPQEWKNTKKGNPFYNQLISHIYALSMNDYLTVVPEESHSLLLKLVQYLIDIKTNYSDAKILIERISQLHQRSDIGQNLLIRAELMEENANLLLQLGDYTQAVKNYNEVLKIYRDNAAIDPLSLIIVSVLLCQLGGALYSQGNYQEAKNNYDKSLAIHEKIDSKNKLQHPNVAIASCGIGNILFIEQNYNGAELAYQRGLKIYTSLSEERTHKDIADVYCSLAVLAYEQGNYAQALERYKAAQKIYQAVYRTKQHISIAICFYNMSRVLHSLGKKDQALKKARRSLAIYFKIYGSTGHIDMLVIAFHIGYLLCRQKQYKDGIEKYRFALNIYDTLYSDKKINQEEALIYLYKYAEKYYQKEEFEKAETCYLTILQYYYYAFKQRGSRVVRIGIAIEKSKDKSIPSVTCDDTQQQQQQQQQLIKASAEGNLEKVKELCIKTSDINQMNSEGITPLYAAAKNGHLNVIKVLVEVGKANVEIGRWTNNGIEVPLLIASKYEHANIVDYLIEVYISKAKEFLYQIVVDYGASQQPSPKPNPIPQISALINQSIASVFPSTSGNNFYHENLDRTKAELLLKTQKLGAFLFRPSSYGVNSIVLSYLDKDYLVTHCLLNYLERDQSFTTNYYNNQTLNYRTLKDFLIDVNHVLITPLPVGVDLPSTMQNSKISAQSNESALLKFFRVSSRQSRSDDSDDSLSDLDDLDDSDDWRLTP